MLFREKTMLDALKTGVFHQFFCEIKKFKKSHELQSITRNIPFSAQRKMDIQR